ncbi:MAG: hypothetical protein JWM74_2330, partial [Myxococcaceae bacterium]|nr:hypothetical protein [Myxococcaceae bacterium]
PAISSQFAQLSSAIGNVTARYGSLDGGVDSGVSLGSATFGAVGSPTGASIAPPAMAAFGSSGITITSVDGGALLKSSLAEIQQASDPSHPPDDFYKNRTSFVFVLVGDPATPSKIDGGSNPEYGARGLHIVALRSSATVVDGGNL